MAVPIRSVCPARIQSAQNRPLQPASGQQTTLAEMYRSRPIVLCRDRYSIGVQSEGDRC
ncbi:MAG: hypothetical protein ACO4AI_13735 [Prochlorothrix sp.]